jgi:hypothetical protein
LGEKAEVGSVDHGRMMAELARRQTIAQIEATQAQKTACEAEEKAAMRPDSRLLQTAKDLALRETRLAATAAGFLARGN